MFGRLSADTIHRRFFTGMPTLSGPLLHQLVSVDHDAHEAVVITVGEEIVGLASYHRHPDDPSTADVAILVEDGWQHHGIGVRLMRHLTALASERGVDQFHADVLAENRSAIALIKRLSRGIRAQFDAGTLVYDLPIDRAA